MAKEFFKKLALGVAISLTSVAVLAGFTRLSNWLRPDDEVVECTHVGTIKLTGFAPTCTEDGLTDGILCATCQGVIKKQEKIKALGHVYTANKDITPTCVDGSTGGSSCGRCNVEYEPATVIPAVKAHTDDNADGVCDGCGDSFAEGQFLLSKIAYSDNVVETTYVDGGTYEVGTILRVYAGSISHQSWGFVDDDRVRYVQIPHADNLVEGSTDFSYYGKGTITGDLYGLQHNGYVDFYIGELVVTDDAGNVVVSIKKGDTFHLYHLIGQLGVAGYKIITINE